MEPFNFPVGLGPAGSGLLDGGAGLLAGSMPQSGSVAGSVVCDDSLAGDADRGEPGGRARAQNPAAVMACSLWWISEYTMRVRSSTAVWMYR